MIVTAIRTVRYADFPNLVHVLIDTDEGVTGLGETFLGAAAVSAWVHENAAPYLLGRDPLAIEAHWQQLKGFVGMNASSTENRGRSAVDIALWDLYGQFTSQPLVQLLGGRVRDRIRVYNTCAGPFYARAIPIAGEVSTNNWQLGQAVDQRYEDMQAFLDRPEELARDLLANGITGMKMWPFDVWVAESAGQYISRSQVRETVRLFERVREAVGDAVDLYVDLHTLWTLPAAIRIADGLREVAPAWIEDPIRNDDPGALLEFKRSTSIPVCAGETLGTRWSFRDMLERRALDVVMCDPVWVGGVSEARRVAAMAEAYQTPVTMHDCNGPVQLAVSIHLSCHLVNAMIQESVRAYYLGWYGDLVESPPTVEGGFAAPPGAAGHGMRLRPELLRAPGTTITESSLGGGLGMILSPAGAARRGDPS